MNLEQFSALKAGDKVENNAFGASGIGEIVETVPSGVRLVWGIRHPKETRFFYSVNSTAWMHWSKVDGT